MQIPDELTKSWLHLLMALVFAAEDSQGFNEQMTVCSGLVEIGMAKLVLSMDPKPLSGFAIFGPSELVSFVTFQLMQDATGTSQDILETYLDYMKILVSTQ